MAHITSIKIEGLLGRKKAVELELQRDVNVFFGENGSGKTTLLKILDAALSRDAEAMQRLPVERAEINIYSITYKKNFKHVWERKKTKGAKDDQLLRESAELGDVESLLGLKAEPPAWKISPLPASEAKRWQHTFLPTTRLYLGDRSIRTAAGKNQLSEAQLDEMFADSVNRSWLVYYSNTLQEVSRIQEEGLRAVLHDVLSTGPAKPFSTKKDPGEIYRRVVNFLERQPNPASLELGRFESFVQRYKEDENLRRAVNNLDDVERRIEVAMQPIDRFKSTIEGLFSQGKKLSFTSSNQIQVELMTGQVVSAANLSSGEKHLLKMLLSAMLGRENSVLIDEPELSMHIDWQRVFVETVQSLNPHCQLILASHSPEIMADLGDEKIFKI